MRPDEVSLTIPPGTEFHGVAELVLTGLASRRDATVDGLADLRIALDALLGRGETGRELTLSVRVADGELTTAVGPFGDALQGEVSRRPGDEIGLGRILDAVADRWQLRDLPDGHWIELTKHVGPTAEEAS